MEIAIFINAEERGKDFKLGRRMTNPSRSLEGTILGRNLLMEVNVIFSILNQSQTDSESSDSGAI